MTAPEFSRRQPVDPLPAAGETITIAATPEECAALARRFGLESMSALTADLTLEPVPGGVIRLHGDMAARLTQRCVVSLEPFDVQIAEPVRMEFTAEPAILEAAAEDPELDIELIEDAAIDLGEVVAQSLSLALDPYPRRPDLPADALAVAAEPEKAPATGPFAALAALRRRNDTDM